MKLLFITLFPDFVNANFSRSILGRAVKNRAIEVFFINPRDFAQDKHHTVDDAPFGGGGGMVLKAEPFIQAIEQAKRQLPLAATVMLSPDGEVFSQNTAKKLAREAGLIFICGHYEGFDERIKQFADIRVSLGDYILTGGELPAMAVSDAVCRLLPGVLGKPESAEAESFSDGLLEYPQYTRPAQADFGDVPDVLLSGNHAEIARWRRKMALAKTRRLRPDLFANACLQPGDAALLQQIIDEQADGGDD
ncbi:MAG: tRNA (guanosine(37)-N1)-methyltransferase TrmD [Acidaminococcales bacterium]|jgi:tRNA (guanine37-N1)-methyltransferase|nr:tRNA (guanosine(37)-N1)-methyltransferase TrmD [Acidaminococcales bacterium]